MLSTIVTGIIVLANIILPAGFRQGFQPDSGRFRPIPIGSGRIPAGSGRLRLVPAGFQPDSGKFRPIPAGSGRFRPDSGRFLLDSGRVSGRPAEHQSEQ